MFIVLFHGHFVNVHTFLLIERKKKKNDAFNDLIGPDVF